jgi:mannose-1-phosphate guanylyltransferase
MPDLHEGMEKIKESIDTPKYNSTLNKVYGQLRSISIDYGIMEKSQLVYLTKGNFSWSDVGSWEEVYQLSEKNGNGNAVTGNVFIEKTIDSYIYSPGKFSAVIGVDNLIIINTHDALLVCRRDNAQDVKKVIDYLKMNKLIDHL